mmetsp:Transcript_19611/g.75251  ORF Transcript_19611/g.75251 Transcript_19611/m.75251 type:complete len:440 (+) Transcript_19611:1068-2387(+)
MAPRRASLSSGEALALSLSPSSTRTAPARLPAGPFAHCYLLHSGASGCALERRAGPASERLALGSTVPKDARQLLRGGLNFNDNMQWQTWRGARPQSIPSRPPPPQPHSHTLNGTGTQAPAHTHTHKRENAALRGGSGSSRWEVERDNMLSPVPPEGNYQQCCGCQAPTERDELEGAEGGAGLPSPSSSKPGRTRLPGSSEPSARSLGSARGRLRLGSALSRHSNGVPRGRSMETCAAWSEPLLALGCNGALEVASAANARLGSDSLRRAASTVSLSRDLRRGAACTLGWGSLAARPAGGGATTPPSVSAMTASNAARANPRRRGRLLILGRSVPLCMATPPRSESPAAAYARAVRAACSPSPCSVVADPATELAAVPEAGDASPAPGVREAAPPGCPSGVGADGWNWAAASCGTSGVADAASIPGVGGTLALPCAAVG